MSNQNYITEMLELKDSNIFFKENCYYKEKIKGVIHKIFEGYLSYTPDFCPKCGVVFDGNFEKHGFITSNIKIPDVIGFKSILRLHKQRYLCKHCHKAFTLTSNITNYGCFISNITKHKIAKDLTKKRSEKDIAFDNNVSPNTVERVMDSFYETQKLYKNYTITTNKNNNQIEIQNLDKDQNYYINVLITNKKTGQIFALDPFQVKPNKKFEVRHLPSTLIIIAIAVLFVFIIYFYRKYRITKALVNYQSNDINNMGTLPKSITELKMMQEEKNKKAKEKYNSLTEDSGQV